jgi:vacuolar-type H+-ATPase subunit E/Vma4
VTAANSNSQEVLREEILADARRQAGETVRRGKADAEAILTKAKADAEKERQDKVAFGKAEAQRLYDLVLARLPVDVGRMRSARIEALLGSVHDDAQGRLAGRQGFDYREVVVALAAEAIGLMEGNRFVLQLSQADRGALGDGWLQDVQSRVNRPGLELALSAEPAKIQGGVLVRDADNRLYFDNSLQGRLDRLWPAARLEIAVRTRLIQAGGAGEEKK